MMGGNDHGDTEPRSLHDDQDSSTGNHRIFWADEIADRIEARDPDEPITIKGGVSPSGVPHLGNMNEIMRGYFVAAVLRERGHEVRQVFTSDDRDPLRTLPRILCDLDGTLVGLGDVDAAVLGTNLGSPYTTIPDPFGCCDSYGDHFSNIIENCVAALDVPLEFFSMTELYQSGAFDVVIRMLLENRDRAREILSEYQGLVDDDYVPFKPICENCGKETRTVTGVDLREGVVDYRCTDIDAGNRTIEGCGHTGTVTLRDGKLPWRFEWPAQWHVLDVDFEPFGKDHAEGSWPSGEDIARNVLGIEPPVPMVYEWFTLDGKPFSSSAGNVVTVFEVLELIEPEILRYFFAKDPNRARDFSIERIDLLVDEFDRFEQVYFEEAAATEKERALVNRIYPFLVDEIREDRIRLPYTFAAVLGMTDDPAFREQIARREGHFQADTSPSVIETALARVELARTWSRRMDNEYNYDLQWSTIPDIDLDSATEAALDDLANFIALGKDGDQIQGEIYEAARRHGLDVGAFFSTGYRLFLDRDQGPKLGPFLAQLNTDFVVERLRRER